MPGTRWFRSPEAVSAGVLAAIGIATSAARSEQRWEYGPLADALLAGHGLSVPSAGGWPPSAFVEPYYPMLLAATTALAGPLGGGVMIALQIAALVLAARLVAGVASQRLGVPRGAAVLVVALWPPLVIASLKLHPQAFRALLLAALVAIAFTLRERSESKGIRRQAIALGALAGACVWARSVYLVPVAVLAAHALRLASSWRANGERRRVAAIALAVALVVAAPWWIRNAVAFGTFVPFTTNGGLNLAMGNHPGATGEADDDARAGARALLATPPVAPDEVAADRALGRAALSWIVSHPVDAAAGWGRKLGYLLVMRPGAGERYPRLLRWAYVLFACVTTPLLVWGAWRAPPEARRLLLAPALALLGAFAVFAVNQRYRFEADVLLAPFALAGAMHLARAWRTRARRSPWRRSLAAAACVALAVPAGLLAGRPDLAAAALVRDESARLVSVDAVFVASGDVDFHRTRHAAAVFRRTRARWFVVSGAGAGGDSGELMAGAAESFGVPRAAILVETRATNTHQNAVLTRPLLAAAGVRTVAVVTDPLHSRRMAMTATRAWPGVRVLSATVPAAADPLACYPATWRNDPRCRHAVADEWKKLAGYLALGRI